MYEIVIVFLLLVSIAIVALILVQQGKGAGMGASFGAGASNTVFGSAGSGNFLTRSTWILALVFFALCLFIGYLQKQNTSQAGDFTNIEETSAEIVDQSPEDVPSLGGDLLPPTDNENAVESDVPALETVEPQVNDDVVATDAEVKEAIESSNNAGADVEAAAADAETAPEAEAEADAEADAETQAPENEAEQAQ